MFDLLASVVERHLPQHVQTMTRAKIFRLESRHSHNSARQAIEEWEPDERTIENFKLPFKIVAIEYAPERRYATDCCAILSFRDEQIRSMDFLVACGSPARLLISSGSLRAFPDAGEVIDMAEETDAKWKTVVNVQSLASWEGSKAGIKQIESKLEWINPGLERLDVLERGNAVERAVAKYASGECSFDEAAIGLDIRLPEIQRQIAKLETNIVHGRLAVAVLSVLVINEPACFVVEERPLTTPRESALTIRRSSDRPHFIVLKPRQIRERFLWTGNSPDEEDEYEEKRRVSPHERRGHFRRLQSSRFVKAKGHTIWIKPMWIGPQEAVKNGNRYKVRLDL